MTGADLLAQSAPLARVWATEHCDGCDWYHGAWPHLRVAGVISGLAAEASFFQGALQAAAREGKRRVLIAASADSGMLEQVLAAFGAAGVKPEVTVLDLCRTPLLVNDWYARQQGAEVTLEQADVFAYDPGVRFDVVCTHSFFSFVPPSQRGALAERWSRWLASDGLLVTSQSVRPGAAGEEIRFTSEQAEAFADRAEQASGNALLRDLAARFARHKSGHVVRDPEELRSALVGAGFRLESFSAGDEAAQRVHRAASPDRYGSWNRIQIVARRSARGR